MPTITIYTDGSALGNPGPGGYGVVLLSGQHRKELSQGFRLTTNNRILRVYRHHNVRFVWVKGHADTVENNRCDQLAVAAANDKAHLLEDTGYEP